MPDITLKDIIPNARPNGRAFRNGGRVLLFNSRSARQGMEWMDRDLYTN